MFGACHLEIEIHVGEFFGAATEQAIPPSSENA